MTRRAQIVAGLALLLAIGVLVLVFRAGGDSGAPPRSNEPVPAPRVASSISVPIDADARSVTAAIEAAVPRQLWSIEQRVPRCVAAKTVKLFGKAIKVTPTLGCTIVGEATRGPIRVRGEGRDIIADVPIHARISARNVGGIAGETATGDAIAHARIRLDIARDWTPRGTVKLTYDWTTPPGIDFLGNRIDLAKQADEKLGPIVRDLERTLPRELAKLDIRSRVAAIWRRGFTTISLNADRPPVWLRIAPQRLRYDDYALRGTSLRLNLAMDAITETFVGPRPADPKPTALPPLERAAGTSGLRIFLPVVADYGQLEPVILRALVKRSQRPFDLPGIGPVQARFERIQAYGTSGGRIAVGLTLAAAPVADPAERTHGTIWLTARPVNAPGSAAVTFTEVAITGDTDGVAGDLLIALGNSPGLVDEIGGALGQNFAKDVAGLLGKVRAAIADKPIDDFRIAATIDRVESGRIRAYGQGLYLPVRVSGAARISYQPRR